LTSLSKPSINWLDPMTIRSISNFTRQSHSPLDWNFGDATLDLLVKEATSLARHIRPRAHAIAELAKAENPSASQEYGNLAAELSVLFVLQMRICHSILVARAQKASASAVFDVLNSLDLDAPFVEHYIPEHSIKYLSWQLQDFRKERPTLKVSPAPGLPTVDFDEAHRKIINELRQGTSR
jgi:hypothetical protein